MDRRRAEDRSRRREAQYQYIAHTQLPTNPSPRRLGEEQAPSTPLPAQPKRPSKTHTQPPATPSPKRPREEHAPPTPPPTHPRRSLRRHTEQPASPSPNRPRAEQTLRTPPPTRSKRSPKRPRPMRETVQLQRDSVESTLHHYDSCFRAKEQASSTRSWCDEVPVALQVEAAKSFYQAFTEERTLPISHCVFCYRKTPPCELSTVQCEGSSVTLPAAGDQDYPEVAYRRISEQGGRSCCHRSSPSLAAGH
ncbi:hypothetical protein HIM_09658 [Hirsutella minnesotensis 3608]|uniref:Uncharacterized protein n=1 Tax=Hirsutella minnesotensis 3608 TaxID=1043627 RepID=A0A0F8A2Z8_9HYPO|nr:hypothetical protein HIM_09658 [Hirsutella minnesotensis 3608]